MITSCKYNELTNHLGNVLTTISDRKIPHFNTSGAFDYYQADIISSTDYYAFGMEMPGRAFNSNTSTRGMNGQEKDQEIGAGIYTALYWEYDARIGRRWNKDPKPVSWESNYACFGNNPIAYVDKFGDFKHKFQAYAYKIFHGGEVKTDLNTGQYYVGKDVKYRKDASAAPGTDGGVAYQRRFGWNGEKNPESNVATNNKAPNRTEPISESTSFKINPIVISQPKINSRFSHNTPLDKALNDVGDASDVIGLASELSGKGGKFPNALGFGIGVAQTGKFIYDGDYGAAGVTAASTAIGVVCGTEIYILTKAVNTEFMKEGVALNIAAEYWDTQAKLIRDPYNTHLKEKCKDLSKQMNIVNDMYK
ncbi:MAG: hypothetical protein WCK02_06460 [Bacteroidota bacterium]